MPPELEALDTFFLVISFVFGAMLGSFLNVCIHRIPLDQSVVRPRSTCPRCDTAIAWYDNIPILSWLALGAKCRYCKKPISWRYPAVEALTGLLFLLIYWKHGMVIASPVYMVLAAGLVLVTFVDLEHWIIPNEVTYAGIPLGILWGLVVQALGESSGGYIPVTYTQVFHAFLGVLIGGGVLYLLDKACLLILKKRGMGFGDVKLNAMLGAFFGPWSILVIIMIASVIGSVFGILLMALGRSGEQELEVAEGPAVGTGEGDFIIESDTAATGTDTDKRPKPLDDDDEEVPEGHYLPFGPCLAAAGLVMIFFGRDIFEYYAPFFISPGTQSNIPL